MKMVSKHENKATDLKLRLNKDKMKQKIEIERKSKKDETFFMLEKYSEMKK